MTLLGLIFIPWTALTIARRAHHWVPWLIAASMPFMTASAVIAGSNKVSPFYVAAFAPLVMLLAQGERNDRVRALNVLGGVMAVYYTATAIVFPVLFAGTPVLVPRGGLDEQVLDPGELAFTVSNLAQAVYLILSVGIVLYFAKHPPARKHFLVFGFAVGTTLNMWALGNQLTGLYFPAEVFDATVEGGERFASFFGQDQRLRGVFSEPSYLAAFSVAGLIYAAALSLKLDGRARLACLALAGGNALALYFSYSGTAVAAFAATAGLVAVIGFLSFARGGVKVPPTLVGFGLIAAAFGTLALPRLWDYGYGIVTEKVGTTSYSFRGLSNDLAWQVLFDTSGFGAGLGSNRPSSFALLLLSNVGIVGTAMFVLLVVVIVRRALAVGGYQPELLALLAVLVAKVLAEPNLGNPTMWSLLGALAAAFAARAPGDAQPSPQRRVRARG